MYPLTTPLKIGRAHDQVPTYEKIPKTGMSGVGINDRQIENPKMNHQLYLSVPKNIYSLTVVSSTDYILNEIFLSNGQ